MIVTRPIDGVENLLIVKNFISKDEADVLIAGYEKLKTDEVAVFKSNALLSNVKNKIKKIMQEEFSEINTKHYTYYDMVSCRTKDSEDYSYMDPHIDGVPGTKKNNIRSVTCLLYLNSNFLGGELYYPELNFEYKPEPCSAVFHLGEMPFVHGVRRVTEGKRYHFGGNGFSDIF